MYIAYLSLLNLKIEEKLFVSDCFFKRLKLIKIYYLCLKFHLAPYKINFIIFNSLYSIRCTYNLTFANTNDVLPLLCTSLGYDFWIGSI
jgi:hypothetical protein